MHENKITTLSMRDGAFQRRYTVLLETVMDGVELRLDRQ